MIRILYLLRQTKIGYKSTKKISYTQARIYFLLKNLHIWKKCITFAPKMGTMRQNAHNALQTGLNIKDNGKFK